MTDQAKMNQTEMNQAEVEHIDIPIWEKRDGWFVKTDRVVTIDRPIQPKSETQPQSATQPERRGRRSKGASVRKKTVAAKAIAFISAITGPDVSDAVYEQRLDICRENTCGHLQQDKDKLYCGACGCPRWRLAELHTKLRHANLECPCDPPLWEKIP